VAANDGGLFTSTSASLLTRVNDRIHTGIFYQFFQRTRPEVELLSTTVNLNFIDHSISDVLHHVQCQQPSPDQGSFHIIDQGFEDFSFVILKIVWLNVSDQAKVN